MTAKFLKINLPLELSTISERNSTSSQTKPNTQSSFFGTPSQPSVAPHATRATLGRGAPRAPPAPQRRAPRAEHERRPRGAPSHESPGGFGSPVFRFSEVEVEVRKALTLPSDFPLFSKDGSSPLWLCSELRAGAREQRNERGRWHQFDPRRRRSKTPWPIWPLQGEWEQRKPMLHRPCRRQTIRNCQQLMRQLPTSGGFFTSTWLVLKPS